MKGEGLKIRYREGFRWSPPEGQRQEWREFQVVNGRKIVARYDLLDQARRDYPGAIVLTSNRSSDRDA